MYGPINPIPIISKNDRMKNDSNKPGNFFFRSPSKKNISLKYFSLLLSLFDN